MLSNGPPMRRLACAYAVYFGALGISAPYWNLYLAELGFSARVIGSLAALMVAARIIASLGWSWLADRSARPLWIVRSATVLTLVLFTGVFFATELFVIGALMVAWSATLAACLPQLESTTFNHLRGQRDRYGQIRLWGSIGFIATVLALGAAVEHGGIDTILPALACCYGLLIVVFMSLPPALPTKPATARELSFWQVVKSVWLLLLVCFLMQVSHAPFYTFFSIYLDTLDYGGNAIGSLWALGVICEVAVFYFSARIARSAPPERVLTITFAVAALRWFMIAFAADVAVVVALSQCLHGITFGAYHAAAINIIDRRFVGSHQHRGQALYASLTFGVGMAIGSYMSGVLWDQYGAANMYSIAAAVALGAALLSLGLRPSVVKR